MFIRTKKIKGNHYAYIVENKWTRKKVRQRVKKYLGRVYKFPKTQDIDFFEHNKIQNPEQYIKDSSKKRIIRDLIKIELLKHGFKQNKNIWKKDECMIDIKDLKIRNKKQKSIAVAFNEGLLTEFAVKKILNLKVNNEKDTYLLAKAFVEAGLDIPKQLFIQFFNKFFK